MYDWTSPPVPNKGSVTFYWSAQPPLLKGGETVQRVQSLYLLRNSTTGFGPYLQVATEISNQGALLVP